MSARLVVGLLCLSRAAAAAPPPDRIAVVEPTSVVEMWRAASPRERQLLLHLSNATRALRTVVFYQTHRHALVIRKFLKKAVGSPAFRRLLLPGEQVDLVRYAAAFLVWKGPYDNYANRKITLGVAPSRLTALWNDTLGPEVPHLGEIVRLMTDPAFEEREYPESPEGTGLAETGGNLYARRVSPSSPLEPNCRAISIGCERLAAGDPRVDREVSAALRTTATELRAAARHAGSKAQAAQLEALADYFLHGKAEDAKAAMRGLVSDGPETRFRFYAEFLYVMYDFRGGMGKLEATLMATDRELTRITRALASSAAYFEAKLPYGPWRAEFPPDHAPGILMLFPVLRGGPGDEDPGLHLESEIDGRARSLNVVPLVAPEVSAHPVVRASLDTRLRAFAIDADADVALAHHDAAVSRLVLLHELIGHGSGKVDPERYAGADPYTVMGPEGTSLEELRANLAAIALFLDPRLVEVGLGKSRAELETLLRAWVTQYVAMTAGFAAEGNPLVWPHLRASRFLIEYWLEKGVIEQRGGRFALKDLPGLVRVSTELLEVVQRVRATRDETKLRELYARYAPAEPGKGRWRPIVLAKPIVRPLVVQQPYRVTAKGIVLLGDVTRIESVIPSL